MPHILAALVNLNHPGKYVDWGFIQISVANLVVIGIMIVTFVLALVLPFPHHGKATSQGTAATPASSSTEEQAPSRTQP
ncbi:MAG: hypothetical protein ACLQNG_06505 [Acidimicrobiales bacterium]|jgi:hypothetical protein